MPSHWHRSDRIKNCIMCFVDKKLSEFSQYRYITKQGKPSIRYESRCKSCSAKRRLDRYSNPEKAAIDRAASQGWKKRNATHLVEYRKSRQSDLSHRANKAKAQRLRKARIRSGSDCRDKAINEVYQSAIDWEKKLAACVVCDDPLEMKMHVDHIMPLKLGGSHVAENLRVISAKENLKKGAKPHFAMTDIRHA